MKLTIAQAVLPEAQPEAQDPDQVQDPEAQAHTEVPGQVPEVESGAVENGVAIGAGVDLDTFQISSPSVLKSFPFQFLTPIMTIMMMMAGRAKTLPMFKKSRLLLQKYPLWRHQQLKPLSEQHPGLGGNQTMVVHMWDDLCSHCYNSLINQTLCQR